MKETIEHIETKENEPKQIIVELGPGDRPVVWRLTRDGKARYEIKGETLFSVKPGDVFCAVDLPPNKSIDVFRRHIRNKENLDAEEGRAKSHLKSIKKELKEFLPNGVSSEVLHADGQRLPFADNYIDVLFMANVMGGHVRDDQLGGFEASGQRILREKQNLIKEAKRVLKIGGKLIVEEEYFPAENVKTALQKIINDLKQDKEFGVRDLTDPENAIFVLELTKQEVQPKSPSLITNLNL
ncbi:MAG: methyltransferase domain-containing protein [Candidatus Azambacteria bacterium]|nr:methyltransferase domain-containing protein [Candidatus Azambacteria bacterium]